MFGVRMTAAASGVQLDQPVYLHPDKLSEGVEDGFGGHEEQI